MNKLKLEVISINEDVIVTSAKWSAKSYKAGAATSLYGDKLYVGNNSGYGALIPETNYYNIVDGQGSTDQEGRIFVKNSYYHVDENSFVIQSDQSYYYSNWKLCTDPNHRHEN